MADPHIREAAESLLSSVTSPTYRHFTHSQSINLMSEELVAGHRPYGQMSTVRRFFCLFVTFDILFTSLMWLICVMMRGETLEQIFDREIVHYDVKVSLFDIVLLAIVRFTVLLLFYALLYINNRTIIALSTAGTCALLIAKVFVYDWPNASQPVYEVFLILISFVLAWSEAWFLDFRVLPQEQQAKRIIDSIVQQSSTERTPLLPPAAAHSVYGESTVKWFSPVETPESSPRPPRTLILTQDQIDEYKSMADESMRNAWRVVTLSNWTVEKRGAQKGDIVESKQTDFGKVYRFTGVVDCPAKFLFQELRDNLTRLPEWNPTILKSEFIKQIDSGTDLSYQVTAGGGRGIIAPRDFVILRRTTGLTRDGQPTDEAPHAYICTGVSVTVPGYPPVRDLVSIASATACLTVFIILRRTTGLTRDGQPTDEAPQAYISSGVSVTVPGYPPVRDLVRGHNKVGCWLLKPKTVTSPGAKIEEHTQFQWLMCCDLKGKIPQFILDAAFATVMLDYIKHVRKFISDSKAQHRF